MGNLESNTNFSNNSSLSNQFDRSFMQPVKKVQTATVLKFIPDHQKQTISQQIPTPTYYLQKTFISDSQNEYKFLSKYFQKESIFNCQPQSNQIIKILKITQQAQKGLCSNYYLIRLIFQYSDISIKDQIKIRSRISRQSQQKNIKNIKKHHFRYQDLCNIMFACISSILQVQKMKQNFKQYMQKNRIEIKDSFELHKLDNFMSQLKYNIPINVDRVIIMPDGTIKLFHPFLLDHQNRLHFSQNFFYSPQKMKDFIEQDGIKGRIFQTGLVLLQCALLQSTHQMKRIYNGYSINKEVLYSKLNKAVQIYEREQNLNRNDMNLFKMIQKMIQIQKKKRINLNQCVDLAQNLFQYNKILKQSLTQIKDTQQQFNCRQNKRMSVQQLQPKSMNQISIKKVPILYSNKNLQVSALADKKFHQEKTTARINSSRRRYVCQKKEDVQVSDFNINNFKQNLYYQSNFLKNQSKQQITRDNTARLLPNQSLQIKNNSIFINNKQNHPFLQSLIGNGSNLYNTNKFNFLQSQYEYNNNRSFINQMKKSKPIGGQIKAGQKKEYMYQKILNKSLKSSKQSFCQNNNGFTSQQTNNGIRPKRGSFLRSTTNDKNQKSIISKSKFMDMDNVYNKYDFIQKTEEEEEQQRSNNNNSFYQKKKYKSIYNKQNSSIEQNFKNIENELDKRIPLAFSLQQSKGSSNDNKWNGSKKSYQFTNKKSEVIQKYTPQSIIRIQNSQMRQQMLL